jgi:hypothetical protein
MKRMIVLLLALAAAGWVVASELPDIRRYMKIRSM